MLEIDGLFIIILADLIGFIRDLNDIVFGEMNQSIDEFGACYHLGVLLHKAQHGRLGQHLSFHHLAYFSSKDFAFNDRDIL